MMRLLRDPSFLPSCILGGVGIVFLVLVSVLPAVHAFALVVRTAVVSGLVVAHLVRDAAKSEPMLRCKLQR
jgi:hypothetical protein